MPSALVHHALQDPDIQGVKVWKPSLDQWKQLVPTWTLSDLSVPDEHRDADLAMSSLLC